MPAGTRRQIEGPEGLKLHKLRLQDLLLQELTAPKVVEISALFKLLHSTEKLRFKDTIMIPLHIRYPDLMSKFVSACSGKDLATKSDGELMTVFCDWYEDRVMVHDALGMSHLIHGGVGNNRMRIQHSLAMHAQTQDHADDDEDCVYVFKSTKASDGKKSVPNVCFRHLNNKCKRGADCRFTHDETEIKRIEEDANQLIANSKLSHPELLSKLSLRTRILMGQELAKLKSSSQYSNDVPTNNVFR